MSRIFTLSGPSGVGKTTFLRQLVESVDRGELRLLPRYTDRPKRENEEEGFEHYFTSYHGILQKIFANDFIHIEKWGDYYTAIESRVVEETIPSPHDGIVLASTFGAARLKATYGASIVCTYLWVGDRASLLNPRCMDQASPEIQELKSRLRKKLDSETFTEFETASLSDDQFVEKRMIDNELDIAAVNGRLRSGEDILVVPNLRDRMDRALDSFTRFFRRIRSLPPTQRTHKGGGCFVLMPFRDELDPIYQDHIVKVCQCLNITVTRADHIFSVRPIMEDILESVATARFIIADLTDCNPNVLYETGICHALGKDVILITQGPDVPFDLRDKRMISYEYTPRGMKKLENSLKKTLQTLLYA